MKISKCLLLILVLMVSWDFAWAKSYYPPERINCSLSETDQVVCEEFNRYYLTEELTNATLSKGREDIFHFVSAVAYRSPNETEGHILYTYHNSGSKMVRLKTVNNKMHPDLANGNWIKISPEIFTCTAGYMSCSIIDMFV